jgi:hypothetical protein
VTKKDEQVTVAGALVKIRELQRKIVEFKSFLQKLEIFLKEKYPKWGWNFVSQNIMIWEDVLEGHLKILKNALEEVERKYQ